ncbi:OLC1v1024457C1 [Oldenlandia corymbosa var. corymbosa]|uniref:OLC1v1024457C1 n=1 Tax=Oldenlandia corymbosa var. corymbosa TaxID=529605 RepID=A0AAV1C4V5_OLDCO|nr:OLC1v1024457C1 [Oldenlandia corymbosa var. corymbosa]
MEAIHAEFKKIAFIGAYTLGLMNPRHVLIRFEMEEDYKKCWIRTFWNIGGFSMRMLKWMPGFRFEEDPPVVPIWVALYDLPIEFMHPEVIYSMATALGQPLKVDTPTLNITRPLVARFCVEVDLTKDLPKSVKKKEIKIKSAKPKWTLKGDPKSRLEAQIVSLNPLVVKGVEKEATMVTEIVESQPSPVRTEAVCVHAPPLVQSGNRFSILHAAEDDDVEEEMVNVHSDVHTQSQEEQDDIGTTLIDAAKYVFGSTTGSHSI